MYYTIGQRQGLGIGGTEPGKDEPWYVADKDLEHNRLIVAQGVDNPVLFHTACRITDLHWITPAQVSVPLTCSAKIRYRQQDSDCRLTSLDGDRAEVEFDQPQRAITPGQALVFYDGEQCLGGGTIESAGDS
jgi:tRNA-specific 2-thiouridylase